MSFFSRFFCAQTESQPGHEESTQTWPPQRENECKAMRLHRTDPVAYRAYARKKFPTASITLDRTDAEDLAAYEQRLARANGIEDTKERFKAMYPEFDMSNIDSRGVELEANRFYINSYHPVYDEIRLNQHLYTVEWGKHFVLANDDPATRGIVLYLDIFYAALTSIRENYFGVIGTRPIFKEVIIVLWKRKHGCVMGETPPGYTEKSGPSAVFAHVPITGARFTESR